MTQPIIIIENNPIIQKEAICLLEKEEMDIWYSIDVESSLILIEKIAPVLILVSMDLPKMSGFTLAKILKTNTSWNNILCIGLIDQNNYPCKITDYGMDGFIAKPIDNRTFAKEVEAYLFNNMNTNLIINKRAIYKINIFHT